MKFIQYFGIGLLVLFTGTIMVSAFFAGLPKHKDVQDNDDGEHHGKGTE